MLPDGKVQLTVLKEKTGWVPANLTIPSGYTLNRWHHFKIEYDGQQQIQLWIDGEVKGQLDATLVDAPALILIGNPSLPHTSTFNIDDIRIYSSRPQNPPGKIYVVLCSDTGTWNGLNMSRKENLFGFELFSDPASNAYQVIQQEFRSRFQDWYGEPLVMTWFMLVGSIMARGTNPDVEDPWISNLEMMQKYHGDRIYLLGDELSFHYHNWVWSDPDGDGVYHWNQSVRFREYRDDFVETVGHLVVHGKLLPTSFRSGWHYMDNEWECFLDGWIPYRFENASPAKHTDTTEPLDNIYDWSRAPLEWIPYHPDSSDYQRPGNLRGWESRCQYMKRSLTDILRIFAGAYSGKDQVVTFWSHLPEKDFPDQIARIDSLLHRASAFYPDVQWDYCTATEAMQKWRGIADNKAPEVFYSLQKRETEWSLTIAVNEPIWQAAPLVFGERSEGRVVQLYPFPQGNLTWQVRWKPQFTPYQKIGIGVTDTAGNSRVKVIDLIETAVVHDSRGEDLPSEFQMIGVYPNPAKDLVWINVRTPLAAEGRVELFNLLGENIRSMSFHRPDPGNHQIVFSVRGLPAGVYFFRLRIGQHRVTSKLLIR